MRLWLMILILGGIGFACQIINVSNLDNSTISLTGDCIEITNGNSTTTINYIPVQYNITQTVQPLEKKTHIESNISCQGNDVRMNLNYNMLTGSSVVDPISNNTYNCPSPSYSLINQTINQGESYYEQNRNVSVSCVPLSCKRNIEYTVVPSETFNDPISNITVHAPARIDQNIKVNSTYNYTNSALGLVVYPQEEYSCPKTNDIVNLTLGQNYTIDILNKTIYAPQYPKINWIRELYPGENYVNSDLNLSVLCMGQICKQGISKPIVVGEEFYNELCDIRILAPTLASLKSTEIIQAEYGVDKTDSKYGVVCRGPPKYTQGYNLTNENPLFVHEPSNLVIQCTYNKSVIPLCAESEINWESLNALNLANRNCTKKEVCLDMYQYMCTKEEAFAGDIYGCTQRVLNETEQRYLSCSNQSSDLQIKLNACTNNQGVLADITTDMVNLGLLVAVFIIALVGVIVYVAIHARKSKKKTPVLEVKKDVV